MEQRTAVGPGPTAARLLLLAGSALIVTGAALPWFRLGGRNRSAFAIARSAQLLDLVDTPVRRAAVTVLFFTPMLGSAVLLVVALGRRRLAAVLGGVLGVVGSGTGTVGLAVSGPDRIGPMITSIGSAISLLAAVWLVRRAHGGHIHDDRSADRPPGADPSAG